MDGARLKAVSVSGTNISASLAELCVGASLSAAVDQVTEMGFTFLDSLDLDLFRSKLFAPGATVRYGDWHLTCDGLKLQSGSAGPQVTINAPSKFVTALRGKAHQGAKSWGTTDLSAWVKGVAASVGMSHMVQPGLGVKSIARVAAEDGGQAESTWDVLAQQAKESGVWLFEYGSTLVFAKPSYLVRAVWPRRVWPLVWHNWNDHSEGMAGMPQYADDPSAELRESMTVKLTSPDADQCRPGDAVTLTGRAVGAMGGTWIVRAVDFPLHAAAPVVVACQRPIDPKVEPPRTETSSSGSKASTSGRAAAASSGSTRTPSGIVAAAQRFFNKYNGVAIDADGAFGAQCVDLTRRYATEVFGAPGIMGNGRDWFVSGANSGFFRQVSASAQPQVGDIACWGPAMGGGYGHVAIVMSEDWGNGSVRCMSQNPGPARMMTITRNGLQGYLRPTKAAR
jgi:surface antigen